MLGTSDLHHQHGHGVWVGHCARCLQLDHQHRPGQGGTWGLPGVNSVLCLKEWDPRAQGPLAQYREVQEFSLVCAHCECLGARGKVACHSLQGCGSHPLQVMADQ